MSTIETSLVQDEKEANHITSTSEEISEIGTSNSMRQMNVKKLVTQVQFLLCPSCFWCASYIGLQSNKNSKILIHCIVCKNDKIESLPISINKSYRFDYSKSYGKELFQMK
jgi:hypothetical protein